MYISGLLQKNAKKNYDQSVYKSNDNQCQTNQNQSKSIVKRFKL